MKNIFMEVSIVNNSEWKLETKVTNKLKYFLDGMYTYYRYEEIELFGQPYLKVTATDVNSDYWPESYFCHRWVQWQQDKSPIDICNITIGQEKSFCVAEIYKRCWNSAPYEWKRHNREVVGY